VELHTVEPLPHDPSPSEFEIAIAKSKRYKSPGSDQILAELIQAGGETILSKIHKSLVIFGIRKIPRTVEESYFCTNLK
jgi:hypothetical protein